MRLKTEEFLLHDVKELDSDEERCDLVDDKNGHDRHFFCQKQIIAELRQRHIDDYLHRHSLRQIPQGINTKSIDILLNLHLYLYHRLPSKHKLAELKHALMKAKKQDSPKKKSKKEEGGQDDD